MLKIIIFALFVILLTLAMRMGDAVAMVLSMIGFLALFVIADELEEKEK